jgi:hypothetical protein
MNRKQTVSSDEVGRPVTDMRSDMAEYAQAFAAHAIERATDEKAKVAFDTISYHIIPYHIA